MPYKNRINTGLLIVGVLIFFLPFFTVSCNTIEIEFTGMELVFGKNIETAFGGKSSSSKTDSSPIFALVLALIVISIVFSLTTGKLNKFTPMLSLISLIALSTVFIDPEFGQKNQPHRVQAITNFEYGFYLELIVLLIVTIFGFFRQSKRNEIHSDLDKKINELQNE